jgi:hypothetical protein
LQEQESSFTAGKKRERKKPNVKHVIMMTIQASRSIKKEKRRDAQLETQLT